MLKEKEIENSTMHMAKLADSLVRRKEETTEEKKQRKQAVKEERRVRFPCKYTHLENFVLKVVDTFTGDTSLCFTRIKLVYSLNSNVEFLEMNTDIYV